MTLTVREDKRIMPKRLISVCIIVILVCSIYGCAQTAEDTSVTEPETVETEHTETMNEEDPDKEATETEKAETNISTATDISEEEVIPEISEDIGDCKWVYDSWMEFDDEGQLPYAGEETYQFIKAAYDEVDFIGEFKKGDLSLYDDYKNKYKRLIHNEVPFYDVESGTEVYINDFIQNFVEDNVEDCKYIFFDVDEDNAPELSIAGQSHIYILDYDYETNEYAIWYPMEGWYSLIGSRKVLWWWEGMLCAYYQLDQKGEEECYTFFFQNVQGFNKPCLVMIPEYADDSKKVEIPKEMKSEGVYTRTGGHWYFRVTQEQYEELLNKYIEAYQLAEEKRQDVTYSYEELFSPFTLKTEGHD